MEVSIKEWANSLVLCRFCLKSLKDLLMLLRIECCEVQEQSSSGVSLDIEGRVTCVSYIECYFCCSSQQSC